MNWDHFREALEIRNSGQTQAALYLLEKLANGESEPISKAVVLMGVTNTLRLMGRFTDARAKIHQALALTRKNPEYEARCQFLAAEIDGDEGNWNQALRKLNHLSKEFEALLSTEEDHDLLHKVEQTRGIALCELRRFSESRAILEELRHTQYERTVTLCYLGICEFELGDLDNAKFDFDEMLRLDPPETLASAALFRLGVIHFKEGQMARARDALQLCLESQNRGRLAEADILRWLIATSEALNLDNEARIYSDRLTQINRTSA